LPSKTKGIYDKMKRLLKELDSTVDQHLKR
jgi:hypothetical protein